MKAPTTTEARERLATAYALDRLWGETMGLPGGDSKEGPLRLVAQLLEREGVPYALIGGVAVQLHTEEPRSTLDIDLAVPTYADIPRQALLAEHPELASAEMVARVQDVRRRLMSAGPDRTD